MSKRFWRPVVGALVVAGAWLAMPVRAEVMLQWFETDWDEMYQKMPKVAEIGYDSLWIPPPTKGPTGRSVKWANVGYNLYDRFDIGDMCPSAARVKPVTAAAVRCAPWWTAPTSSGIKIIPDIVMNHNGNGPDFREYPGHDGHRFSRGVEPGLRQHPQFQARPPHGPVVPQRGLRWNHVVRIWPTWPTSAPKIIPLNPDPKRFTGQKTD
jgi:glycosidase